MTDMPASKVDAALKPPRNQWWDVWDQFKTHKGALVGLIIFSLILFGVTLGPFLWRIDPTYVDPNPVNMLKLRNQGPSFAHPFGTDQLGRDLLARLMAGGKVSIAVGMTAMLLSLLLGTLIGVLAGFFRRLDGILMSMTDLFLSLPLLPLLLLMVTLFREPLSQRFGTEAGIFMLIVVAIGVTSWMQTARIVRGEVLALKEREYVLAARSIGTPARRMVLRHILPNVMSPIMVSATLGIANAIITESALSFLGLGFPPDFPTWGRILFDAVDQMQLYPLRVILPGVAISLTVLSVNYIGDGLRDALDPRIRGR
ncbi:ABC transporter permease [Defluviimonas sp. WL0002]|uniref:ABC transporter permease n=1 Tax=Albidovulum marisflavi TaxID=2984159 RepID=A0ABT2ZF66_9RHOB|nr:ABC transporter permease [Defluviimonas sp. WL0002]MCV2869756.1 ABC transporter permease [Defluviimonas sp. WL0002]